MLIPITLRVALAKVSPTLYLSSPLFLPISHYTAISTLPVHIMTQKMHPALTQRWSSTRSFRHFQYSKVFPESAYANKHPSHLSASGQTSSEVVYP